MMLRGFRSFKQFLESEEGVATNILADRLRNLERHGIICSKQDSSDHRKRIYLLTPKGKDLAPVLTEMVLWAAAHEKTQNRALVEWIKSDKEKFLTDVRSRLANQTPIQPRGNNPQKES